MLPKNIIIIFVMLLALLPTSITSAANTGTIQSLTASGGANPGETITISISIRADSRVNNSNVFFQIISPGGVVVATHTYSPPSMRGGDTAAYSWTSNNSGYPEIGNYTVTACWSPGGSTNCQISSASTTFYSADSLGPFLLIGLFLIGVLAFRIHKLEIVH